MSSLRGHLLIAAPGLLDPNFARTVVLLGEHGDEGAMGVVLNRRTDASVDEAIPALSELLDATEPVYIGGPVQPQAVVVLGEFDDPSAAAAVVMGRVGFLPSEIEGGPTLEGIGRTRVFAGYAGWGPGQLESELSEQAWIVEPATPDDVFTEDPDGLWSTVLRRKGGAFTLVSTMPLDPTRN